MLFDDSYYEVYRSLERLKEELKEREKNMKKNVMDEIKTDESKENSNSKETEVPMDSCHFCKHCGVCKIKEEMRELKEKMKKVYEDYIKEENHSTELRYVTSYNDGVACSFFDRKSTVQPLNEFQWWKSNLFGNAFEED